MSEFNIERLRSAVRWAEKEAMKPAPDGVDSNIRGGRWDQAAWMRGKPGRRRKIEAIRFIDEQEYETTPSTGVVEVTCGTSFCVAGHVCLDAKDRFVVYDWEVGPNTTEVHADLVVPVGSKEAISVSLRAQELLGISGREANRLFEGFNTIEDIRRIAEDIARDRGFDLFPEDEEVSA